jgi:hypothetical protein
MYSACDTFAGGFPHSEISGSKLICQLPEAYRRLSRPSSPIIAKASTTCSYSLDPITLTFLLETKAQAQGMSDWSFTNRVMPHPNLLKTLRFYKIEYSLTQSKMLPVARCTPNLYECVLSTSNADFRLYEFLKNSRIKPKPDDQTTYVVQQQNHLHASLFVTEHLWWRMTGSNRRPPACKAGALPAELIPHRPCTLDE